MSYPQTNTRFLTKSKLKMSEIKPTIDDQFWFDRSAEMVKDAGKNLDVWADRVRDMIVWAFGLYTAASILTVEFRKIDESWILVILAIPYLIAILVYWQTQAAQVPIDITFHQDSPTQIKKAYTDAYEKKSAAVNQLVRWSFITLLSIAAALISVLLVKNEQRGYKEPLAGSYLNGAVDRKQNRVDVIVTGTFPADSLLSIQTRTIYIDEKTKASSIKDSSFTVLNLPNGILQQNFVTDTSANSVIYGISWSEGGYRKVLQKEFPLKGKTKYGFR